VTQVIAFEGDGKLIEYVGGYEDWVRVKKYQATAAANKSPSHLPPQGGGRGSTAAKAATTTHQGEGRGEGRSGGSKASPSPQPSDKTTSHSTRPPKGGDQVAGYPSKGEGVKSKLSYKEARELEELPKRIEALEREQSDIAAHLADGAIYRTDAKRAKQLQMRNEEIEAEVLAAMARWEELEKRSH
jgi:ATP-binding cassette subfamily F protein uup